MKFKIAIVAFGLFSSLSMAQQKAWTLEACVAYAEDNNLSIAQFELDYENALIDNSDALGAMLPSFNTSMSSSGNTGLALDPTTNSLITSTIFSASGNVGSGLTLFDGLRNVHRLNRAKLSSLASEYRLNNLKDDIRLAVANSYLQVLSGKESAKVAQAQLAVSMKDLERTRALSVSGVVPKGDVLEIEATVAGQEQQLVAAQNSIIISRIALAQLLQITDYENFDISEEIFMLPNSSVLDNTPKEIFEKALTFRSDIKLSMTNVAIANKDLQIAKGGLYPTIGAFFNYNTRYSDQNFNRNTGELVAFKDQLWINDGVSFGAQLSVPVFNGFTVKNNIKRSKISLKRTELQFIQDKLTLETNINQAYADVNGSVKSFEAAQKTLEARSLAFQYTKERFEVGLLDAFNFSQAQLRVDNAQANLISAKYNYIFRLKVLEFYFGIPLAVN
ncbi:MAG: TolC family protein [Flavobacteriaceae bacterium]|jgi:outer membrane protein|tara:strand:+ start:36384 stop:37724 length:1341 start_codon:yes stop_codon:yes gene_type:complete